MSVGHIARDKQVETSCKAGASSWRSCKSLEHVISTEPEQGRDSTRRKLHERRRDGIMSVCDRFSFSFRLRSSSDQTQIQTQIQTQTQTDLDPVVISFHSRIKTFGTRREEKKHFKDDMQQLGRLQKRRTSLGQF
ncbi:hypothetical protein WMY93_019059 [Mugilogobius chulae]|uniref:Uncharacterized protein n=1 Tax=Mugilogobius chulae TaxID=88201 RepID=A0AAW0NK47_9GOBI